MQHMFNCTDTRVKLHDMHHYLRNDRYRLFSFLRNPLSRFYSYYDEAADWSEIVPANARSTMIIGINSANLRMIGIVNRRKVSMTAI